MSFTHSLHALRTAQKSKRGVSFYSRWINRPLGRFFAAAAVAAGIGPNAVTLVSATVTLSALFVLVIAPMSLLTGIIVSALLVLGFALDSADGQVARLTGTSSPAGEWLDHVVDSGKMVGVHTAVLVALWRNPLVDPVWYALPLAYLFVSVVFFSALTLFSLLVKKGPAASASPSTLRAIALLPADYGVLAIAFTLWGVRPVFLIVYLLLCVATTIIASALCAKWFRALSHVPRD